MSLWNPAQPFLIGYLVFQVDVENSSLLMKTWILRCSCSVVLQVSDPYSSTDFTLELKIFSLVCLEMILDFHNLSKMWNATLAFPSLCRPIATLLPFVSLLFNFAYLYTLVLLPLILYFVCSFFLFSPLPVVNIRLPYDK